MQLPAELSACVGRVILRVAPTGQVADDPRRSFCHGAGVCPAQTQLGFANPGGPGHHGERSRQEAAAEFPVKLFDTKSLPGDRHRALAVKRRRQNGTLLDRIEVTLWNLRYGDGKIRLM